jgi:hypothetical protein
MICITEAARKRRPQLDSVLYCLNTKSPKSLKVVLHGFEFFVGVTLPIYDLARDSKRIRARYDFVGLPGYFLSVRLGSSSIGPVGSTM